MTKAEFPLPLSVRGPRGWAYHGPRNPSELEILSDTGELLGRVEVGGFDRGKFLGLVPFDNNTELFLAVPRAHGDWEFAWRAVTAGISAGLLDRFGEDHKREQIGFTGTRVLLHGNSVDRPAPGKAAWRFWIQGGRFAEAEAVGQEEVRIHGLHEDATSLPEELVLAWLLGIVLTAAASA